MTNLQHLQLVVDQKFHAVNDDTGIPWRDVFTLNRPRVNFGVPIGQALMARRSVRGIAGDREVSSQILSELLWSANGVNRAATGDRTAPSWYHVNELEVFVLMSDGVWLYKPESHSLKLYFGGDIRSLAELQDVAPDAPLHLIYVGNRAMLRGMSPVEQMRAVSTHAGFAGQSVSLYCASEGLASVFRVFFDTEALASAMRLSDDQFIAFGQAVGYPEPDFA
ncbi:MAG TPA: nitroreductase family protein [Rhodopila sp.]|nr:nitroreductase family protein [Rhodopila sp.]